MLRRWAPLAASLAGHLALIALVGGAARLAGPTVPPAESVVPVRRERDAARPVNPRLRLDEAGPEEPAAAAADAAVMLDTADPRYRPYLSGVKRRIWERWQAPEIPQGSVARGVLVVEFTLTRSGRLASSGVRVTSGVPALDQAALEAVARAVPFTPLPPTIAGESMRVRARFIYD